MKEELIPITKAPHHSKSMNHLITKTENTTYNLVRKNTTRLTNVTVSHR